MIGPCIVRMQMQSSNVLHLDESGRGDELKENGRLIAAMSSSSELGTDRLYMKVGSYHHWAKPFDGARERDRVKS